MGPRKPRVNCPTCGQETMAERLAEVEDRAAMRHLADLLDLIKWLAPRIERRNGNGAVSDKLCLLCVLGQPQYKREPCRHDEIFQIRRTLESIDAV